MRSDFTGTLDDVGKGPFHASEDSDASNQHHNCGSD
jgi:hypothetical protein